MRPLSRYGRLSEEAANNIIRARRRKLVMILSVLFGILVAAALISVSVGILVFGNNRRNRSSSNDDGNANAAGSASNFIEEIGMACGLTLYPQLCMSTLVTYPGVEQVREPKDLAHITLNVTMDRVLRVYQALALNMTTHNWDKQDQERVVYQDCVELLQDTIYQLDASMAKIQKMSMNPKSSMPYIADVNTWLSAALTNQDTCQDGFQELIIATGGNFSFNIKKAIEEESKKLSELVSNSLAMFQILFGTSDINDHRYQTQTNNFTVVQSQPPIQNRRRLLSKEIADNNGLDLDFYEHYGLIDEDGMQEFPRWLSPRDRRLLQLPAPALYPDAVVAKDGSGNYTSIADAVMDAPSNLSSKKYIIYVKAGVYNETVTVPRKKSNLMFVGDGRGKTVIQFGKNVKDGSTTFRSATFAASGEGFIARDITFFNNAGPEKNQAVALRVGADFSIIYHCSIIGYQDTLYVHSLRQFYRECDIYGTVDFIFGNAAVVLQKCYIYARKPMAHQKNTITAQGRKDPNQNTGISIHNCRVMAASDLVPVKASYPTYLGRPWKLYSRTVYMQTFLDDLIHAAGWLEWAGDFALKSLYYGEYMNYGPGARLDGRVKWPGYRVILIPTEAIQFTVLQLISGSRWLPSTGIPFIGGLLV